MTPSGDGKSWLGAWPGFLVAFLLTAGAVLVQSPLTPDRPTEVSAGLAALGDQDVDARLWQDPFGAVDKALEKVRKEEKGQGTGPVAEPRDLAWLAKQIRKRLGLREPGVLGGAVTSDGIKEVRVLAVLVAGGPFLGSAELRRRDRYAVLSGLMLERFLPEDPEHIGYLDLALDQQSPPKHVPFEWFSSLGPESLLEGTGGDAPGEDGSQASPRGDLLLLWIDQAGLMEPAGMGSKGAGGDRDAQTASGRRILTRLSGLFGALLGEVIECSGDEDERRRLSQHIRISVIGPRDSTGLEAIASEYAEPASACSALPAVSAQMWSPFATIPDVPAPKGLPQGVCDCPSPELSDHCVAIHPPGPRHRSIADDGVLVDLLVGELRDRHVGPNSGVALVGQWDTAYSRALASRFTQRWLHAYELDPRWGPEQRVFRFSYMRGLDGAVPGDMASSSSRAQDKDSAKGIERAAGDAQLDYLRRMKNALLDKDAELRADCTLTERVRQDCGIRAIGVLGNDYFDKLLVLKALKPVFGNAIFFTTDLDADMLHPEDNRATRNLIVASGFGLTLKRGLQREVPPLRDSYQTSLMLAVGLALRPEGERESTALPPPAPRPPLRDRAYAPGGAGHGL